MPIHYELADEHDFPNRIQIANAIAEQIWREQHLVSNRMQWNFTFQGFLGVIYVFAGANLDGWDKTLVQSALSILGFIVALFCLFGVMAAQKQSDRLKRHWTNEFCKVAPSELKKPGDCDITKGAFPQPFSRSKGSKRGRLASRGVCYALMGTWASLLLLTLILQVVQQFTPTSTHLVCTVDISGSDTSGVRISCNPK